MLQIGTNTNKREKNNIFSKSFQGTDLLTTIIIKTVFIQVTTFEPIRSPRDCGLPHLAHKSNQVPNGKMVMN